MGKINSRRKGVIGEHEVRDLLKEFGYSARRGQQYCGANGDPDVVSSLEGFHIEVKRVERFNLYEAMKQAERDMRDDEEALIFHRKNKEKWVVALDAKVFLRLLDKVMDNEV